MALINCSECGNQVSDKAEKCPHCGISFSMSLKKIKNISKEEYEKFFDEERIKKKEWEKIIEEELKKKKEIANKFRKKSNPVHFAIAGGIIIICYFAYSHLTPNIKSNVGNSNNSSYCYDMWYKYGSCVYRSANGLPCKAGTDVIIPSECQNFSGRSEASKAGMLSNK